jgi:hypothetical protein
MMRKILFVCSILLSSISLFAQRKEKEVLLSADSGKTVTQIIDSSARGEKVKKVRVYSPRKAAIRSAILPGWGQIYNRKYWKLPIVYGAIGLTGYVFIYNYSNYKDTRFAYKVKYNMRVNRTDTALFPKIKKELQPLSEESLRFYRDEFRRDIDYSVLIFVLAWGLNIVDAAVDAHLKAFDVSPDLSFQLKPGHSAMAGTNGISLILNIGTNKKKALLPSRF